MSSKEATKEVEADEVIAADVKKDAVKGTKRPAEVSSCFYIIKEIFCMTVREGVEPTRVLSHPSAAIGAWA